MVRVISVHHFTNQQVLTVEQPTASTVAPPNRLLLALSNHSIEVRDLQLEGDVLFSFPTVDEVAQIYHCVNGDYVATLESKFNRQNRELNFVRVYLNWDSLAAMQQSKMNHSGASLGSSECGMVQPMRARIAGRVTPTTNQSELGSLEMIEIPVKRNPHLINVCQTSGNLLICSERILTIYSFTVKTHDISKLKFIDFEEAPLYVELAFRPKQCELAENYVACMNTDSMHLFKIVSNAVKHDLIHEADVNDTFKFSEDETIDFKKLIEEQTMKTSNNVTINLPMILRENSAVHRHSPFTFSDKDLIATIKPMSPITDSCNYQIDNLIQLKLKPILIDNTHKQVNEEFKTMVLKPLYIDEAVNKKKHHVASPGMTNGALATTANDAKCFFRSQYTTNLHSVACLIATQQEGYMYQFVDQDSSTLGIDNCITVYPFTAPVFKLVIEDYFLHALTETGLESYTLRLTHRLCQSLQQLQHDNTCPPLSESVCLVGLRPFIGIEQLLLCNNHIVLLANAESSPTHSCNSSDSSTAANWTLYSLELPTPRTIFNDIAIVANSHRFTSATTYCHLMSEAHMILRSTLMLYKWTCDDTNVKHAKPYRNDPSVMDSIDIYKSSCALLGDHYIMCKDDKDYTLAPGYYKLAGVQIYDVIRRVKKLQEQSNVKHMQGLIMYLKIVLLAGIQHENVGNRAKLSEAVLDLFEKHKYDELPSLILKVPMLREYGTDNLITIMSNHTIPVKHERRLALIILHILKGNLHVAQCNLVEIPPIELSKLLEANSELLFESIGPKAASSFSELTTLLTTQRGDLLARIFATMIERKAISLGKLLKIFLDYLPSSAEASQYGQVLQIMLEHHFRNYFGKHDMQVVYDRSTHEAIKLLVRSYLSQMQYSIMHAHGNSGNTGNAGNAGNIGNGPPSVKSMGKSQDGGERPKDMSYLFINRRHEYLNKMPPFAALVLPTDESRIKFGRFERGDLLLKKLQALLCSKTVPNQVLLEVNSFLGLNEALRGRLSLQICIMSVNDAVGVLADECPQCLLQYAKDVFTKPDEWKLLIATVQQKILTVSHTDPLNKAGFYYKKLLKDILTHVAVTMNLENLINVFPQHMDYSTSYILDGNSNDNQTVVDSELNGKYENETTISSSENHFGRDDDEDVDILNEIQDYNPYITLCKETMHANQIKKLITATGQQLLCTLNL